MRSLFWVNESAPDWLKDLLPILILLAVIAIVVAFIINFPAGLLETSNLTYDPPAVIDNGDGTRTISVLGHVDSPTFFMRLLGWSKVPVSALGQSVRRDVVLTLVLDRSGSMNSAPGSSPEEGDGVSGGGDGTGTGGSLTARGALL